MKLLALAMAPWLLAAAAAEVSARETHLVIIAGLGGDEEHRARFHEWSTAMRESATSLHGLSKERVHYLGESPEGAEGALKATKENIAELFRSLSASVRPGDQIYVLLLGHGSDDTVEPRFNLPGKDLTAAEFDALLSPFSEQQIVFVDTTSASGGFLPVLARKNRIVVTATKSGFERNESQFGKYFVEAYAADSADSGSADTDKNSRISVLEAFEYARLRVEEHYKEQNLLKTEHAQLDGDGDGKGSTEPGGVDAEVAGAAYLFGANAESAGVSAEEIARDPELARLVSERRELEAKVEALKLRRESMPEELYLEELERLLLELAALTQGIDERAKK
jgi:hypothetical protein